MHNITYRAERMFANVCMYACTGIMALIATINLCTKYKDSVPSVVSVGRVHMIFSTAGFKGEEKPCPQTHKTSALRRGIQKSLCI